MADNINLYYHIKVSIGYFDIKLNIISLNYGHDYFKKKKNYGHDKIICPIYNYLLDFQPKNKKVI